MRKIYKSKKWKKQSFKKSRKKNKRDFKRRKIHPIILEYRLRKKIYDYEDKRDRLAFANLAAPTNFSFIDNTDEVLNYILRSEKHFRQNRGVIFDKANVNNLTSDAIAFFIAFLSGKSKFRGNSPSDNDLKKLFEESGFYDHVRAMPNYKSKTNASGNMLHKESNNVVTPEIAGEAVMRGIEHTNLTYKDTDPVYDTLIECMQNTNNHASLNKYGNCNWWLYVYNDPNEQITKYSFVDLGVGIFSSLRISGLLNRMLKFVNYTTNIDMVQDLLDGKIQSRIDEDNEIRGKGIPQIVEYAKTDYFRRFYIIANDVKVNVKSGEKWQLNANMNGTFLYWELQNKYLLNDSNKNGN